MGNEWAPCLEKKCSACCNPVKVGRHFDERRIPKDKNGEKIWEKNDYLLVPESHPDTVRLKAYKCRLYDKKTGQCQDYENRPDICKRSSCIDKNSEKTITEQQKEMKNEKYMKLNINLKK
jgi:Fe-S-cluster containining protein